MSCDKSVKFDFNPVKQSFYSAWSAIFSNCHETNETAVLLLQESYSLSVLMYALRALHLQCKQLEELNACWNSVIRTRSSADASFSRCTNIKGKPKNFGELP